ncbi:patatin-like phospholipase family protein [Nitrosospira sp. Is2]|uniref:patatin-like phospholipase family protein n=1 Tax=Nitrosospira sp. Is2 TaxID=3080532 RepID=UPI002954D539|nr:patatin-like phospholipase family protein [Nitrosospira sp. Is2]WON74447.1 patatin-like phospholipase family protein [Nitrosospira sp. Is2]
MQTTEALDLMRMHGCFQGLEEDALAEIAEHMEVVRYKPNEYVHQPNTHLAHIYFVVQGSLSATHRDLRGNEKVLGILSRDDQFGAITGGALSESLPEGIVARTNCTLLKLEHEKALILAPKYPKFRFNVLQAVARAVRRNFIEDKSKPQPSIVAIFHSSPATRPLTQRLVRRLAELGEQPCVLSDQDEEKHEEGVNYAALGKENCELSISKIREQVIRRRNLGRLFIDVDAALNHELASKLIEVSDSVMWCVQAGDEKSAAARLKAGSALVPGCREKINLVWLLAEGCQTSPFAPELKELASYDFKVAFSEPQPPLGKTLASGVERLVHYLRGIKIGLALGGGAARGMAHLGVLQVLEQNGIVVDMIAGTSAGALTGIPYASGVSADHWARQFASDLKPPFLFRCLPNGDHWYLVYKYRTGQFDAMLRKYFSDARLEQLPIPSCAVTLDLISGEAIVRDGGDVVHAILESINLPGLSMPIFRNGQALVDGGLVKNIPADVLVSYGCNFVIAVSVTAKIEHEFPPKRSRSPQSSMSHASTVQTIMRSLLVQNKNVNSFGLQPADAIIEPDVTRYALTEFVRAEEMAEIGAQTALAELPTIKEQLMQLDNRLFVDVVKP